MVSSVFGIGVSGLRATQKRMEAASQNITNAATPGYHKQLVSQSAVFQPNTPLQTGLGTKIDSVYQSIDMVAERQLFQSKGQYGYYESASGAIKAMEEPFAEYAKGLTESLGEMQAAFGALASAPESVAARQNVLSRTENVANVLNAGSQVFAQGKSEFEQQKRFLAQGVNDDIERLSEINRGLSQSVGNPSLRSGFVDEALKVAHSLAEKIGGQLNVMPTGEFAVTVNGQMIVGPGGQKTTFDVDNLPSLGGQIGGIQKAEAKLDEWNSSLETASNLWMNTINAQHGSGVDGSGAPAQALVERDSDGFFKVALTEPGQVSTGVTQAFGNDNASILSGQGPAGVQNASSKLTDELSTVALKVGQSINSFDSQVRLSSIQVGAYQSRIDEVSGVDLEQEAVNLMNYQKQYQAMAKVITVQDSMLDALLSIRA